MTEPEHDLLQTFVEELRAHGVLPPPQPWQDALAGKISVDEAARLRRPFESPEEIEGHKQWFAPPCELEVQRVLQRVHAGARRRRLLLFAPLAVATAAAALLFVALPADPPPPPLGSYQATFHSGYRATRDATEREPLSHDLDVAVHWEFMPSERDASMVELVAFAAAPDRSWHRLDLGRFVSGPPEPLRVRAERLRDLLGGEWPHKSVDLLFFIARPGVIAANPTSPPECVVNTQIWCERVRLALFTEGP